MNRSILAAVAGVSALVGLAAEAQVAVAQEHQEAPDHGSMEESSGFRFGGVRTWIFRNFMVDEGDDATVLGVDVDFYVPIGPWELKSLSYIELADYPREVPGQPLGNPSGSEFVPAAGLSDMITGLWISRRGGTHGKHHFAPGIAAQLPTASAETLGSGKWSVGPSVDYEYESDRLFAGIIVLQVWSVAGDDDRKDLSMLMGKPFLYYSLSDKWDLMYVPYGVTAYWNKPSGEQWYVPVGGGAQRLFDVGSVDMNVGLQLFNNVIRPSEGTVWDLRLVVDLAW